MEKTKQTSPSPAVLRNHAQRLLSTAKELEAAAKPAAPVRLARGTETDVAKEARAAVEKAKANRPYFVGNEGPTQELMQVIHLMLAEHPRTFREILDMTGAGDNRIKGVIMRLQREGVNVVNLGSETRALWFCPSQQAVERLKTLRRGTRRA